MKLPDILLISMLISVVETGAQDSIAKVTADSLTVKNEIVEVDSLLLKHIDSLYQSRNLDKNQTNNTSNINVKIRPLHYCPGCGRG